MSPPRNTEIQPILSICSQVEIEITKFERQSWCYLGCIYGRDSTTSANPIPSTLFQKGIYSQHK